MNNYNNDQILTSLHLPMIIHTPGIVGVTKKIIVNMMTSKNI